MLECAEVAMACALRFKGKFPWLDAEDLAQEALTRIWPKLLHGEIRPGSHRAYTWMTVQRLAFSAARRGRDKQTRERKVGFVSVDQMRDATGFEPKATPTNPTIELQLRELARSRSRTGKYAAYWKRLDWDTAAEMQLAGKTWQDIAEAVGATPNTHFRGALAALKRALEDVAPDVV